MSTVDLTEFDDKGVVLHFDGSGHEVDAITLGKTLVAFSEAAKAIADEAYPDLEIKITIDSESIRPGSLRVFLKIAIVSTTLLLTESPGSAIITSLVLQIMRRNSDSDAEKQTQKEGKNMHINREFKKIIEKSDGSRTTEVVRESVIVPVDAYEVLNNIKDESKIDKNISDMTKAISSNNSIETFGISHSLKETEPKVSLEKPDFPKILQNTDPNQNKEGRTIEEDAIIKIHRAIFERSKLKWGFIWNDFKISGPVLDQEFFNLLEERKIAIKHGDVFEATLRIHQVYDEKSGAWKNKKYEIVKLGNRVGRQPDQDNFEL